MDELILLIVYTVAVNNQIICMKEYNFSLKYFKGEYSREIKSTCRGMGVIL